MSKSVGVTCGICDEEIGEQFTPGDGESLFRSHLKAKHPKEARALEATENAVLRIPWPPAPALPAPLETP